MLLVEVAAAGLLAALLGSLRVDRQVREGRDTDRLRAALVARARADSGCRARPSPTAVELPLVATSTRPRLLVVVRCGR